MTYIKSLIAGLIFFIFIIAWWPHYEPVYHYINEISNATVDIYLAFSGYAGGAEDGWPVSSVTYGQGIAIAPTYVLTAKHVVTPPDKMFMLGVPIPIISEKSEIFVLSRTADKYGYYQWISASVVWTAEKDDLAIIHLEKPVAYYWKGVSEIEIRDKIYFVTSWGTHKGYLADGKIIGKGFCPFKAERDIGAFPIIQDDKEFCYDNLLVIDKIGMPGESGSAILNRYGQLVGIVSLRWKYVICVPVIEYKKIIEHYASCSE